LVDEVADVDAVVDVELHQKVKLAGGRIDLGGDLSVGDPVGHVVGLAQVAFDLDEEGNHARLLPAAPAGNSCRRLLPVLGNRAKSFRTGKAWLGYGRSSTIVGGGTGNGGTAG